MTYYVVMHDVDEIETCELIACQTKERAFDVIDTLSNAFPNACVDYMESKPSLHMKDYDPDFYDVIVKHF